MPRIVYDRRVNLGFPGAQRLHPFDLRKFARAWKELRKSLGSSLDEVHLPIERPVSDKSLLLVHKPEYLQALGQSATIAQALEVPALRRAPWWLLNRFVLQPMRWATAGTVAAGRAALDCGLAFNLGGGFHHAKPTVGEGFSIYNDIAVTVQVLRAEGRIHTTDRVACIDLDAHMGNGVAWCFQEDPSVFLFDMHNGAIYPWSDLRARERIDCPLPLPSGCSGTQYLGQLETELPAFLNSVTRTVPVALAIFNAGTDVLAGDALGGLELSLADVLRRDQFVLQSLRNRQIPTVVVTSGGYSNSSYLAIANTMIAEVQSQRA